MKSKFAVISIFMLFVLPSIQGQYSDFDQLCRDQEKVFISGEKLQYALYYHWNFLWIPAGTLEFYIEEKEDKYWIRVTGKSHESYNWFYKVEDHYHCIMDKEDFKPEYFVRDIQEGEYKIYNEIIFDYASDSIYSTVKTNDKETEQFTFPLENCVLDILSLSYKLRHLDISLIREQDEIPLDLVFDEKIYRIPMQFMGVEQAKMIKGLGRIDLYIFSPDLIAGHVFKDGQKMMLWVSKDGNRIPVMIESPVKVGSIKAILKNYENLKYPLKIADLE
jgi:hypothetical protein